MAVRRKKKSGSWKGFVAGMGLAAIFGLLLVWAASQPSGAKVREAFRSRMSVMADRADQLVNAWNRRQPPGQRQDEKPAPASPNRERPAVRERPALAPRAPAAGDRPVLAPPPAGPATSPAPATAPKAPEPPPGKDITPDDQKQLRELMQQINQGG